MDYQMDALRSFHDSRIVGGQAYRGQPLTVTNKTVADDFAKRRLATWPKGTVPKDDGVEALAAREVVETKVEGPPTHVKDLRHEDHDRRRVVSSAAARRPVPGKKK